MTWQDIETLHNDGHDIEAKSLNHKDLTTLSPSELDFEVGQSKKCLDDHNIDAEFLVHLTAKDGITQL